MTGIRIFVVFLLLFVIACEGSSSSASSVVYEVGAGDSVFYLSSDNLDPKTFGADTANIHKVDSLPNGAVTICKFTVSQGVNYVVWSTGSQSSTDFARTYCRQKGQ